MKVTEKIVIGKIILNYISKIQVLINLKLLEANRSAFENIEDNGYLTDLKWWFISF